MLTSFVKFSDGHTMHCTDPAELSVAFNDLSAQFWVDLCTPTEAEYSLLKDLFGFHPLAIEDVVQDVQRPKLESYALVGDKLKTDYFFLVIHGPDIDPEPGHLFRTTELDIFFSKRYLVTIHDVSMASVSEMFTRVQTYPEDKPTLEVDILLYELLDRLVDKYVPILDDFQELLDKLEDCAIDDPPEEFLVIVSDRKTELLKLRRIMTQQRDILGQMTRGEVPFMGQTSRIYFRDILDHLNREVETIDIYRDLLMGCRDIYMSSINNRLNRIMKTLAIISIVTLPLTVITSFFGMNFADTIPGFTKPVTFAAAMLLMISLPFLFLYLFGKKGWL